MIMWSRNAVIPAVVTLVLSAVALTACSRSSGPAASVAAPLNPRYVYSTNSGDDSVSAYLVDAGAGRLKYIGKVATGSIPASVTVEPGGRYAYVANAGSNSVSQYLIGTDGKLTPMAVSAVAAGPAPKSVTVDPSARYAYVVTYGNNAISQYAIAADGSLTALAAASVAAGMTPGSITVDPSGKYVYVANKGDNTVSQYSIGVNGSLTPMNVPTVASGLAPESVAVDPSGRHVYVTNSGGNSISQYAIGADGGLIPMDNAVVPAGSAPRAVTVDPSGKYLYVANNGSNDVSTYTIDSATGALTQVGCGSPGTAGCTGNVAPTRFAAELSPSSVIVDPSGKYLYAANKGGNSLSQYAIGAGGSLTPVAPATVPAQPGPASLATAEVSPRTVPEQKYTYVTNVTNNFSQYNVAASNTQTTNTVNNNTAISNTNTTPFAAGTPDTNTTSPATEVPDAAPYFAPIAQGQNDNDAEGNDWHGDDLNHDHNGRVQRDDNAERTATPQDNAPILVDTHPAPAAEARDWRMVATSPGRDDARQPPAQSDGRFPPVPVGPGAAAPGVSARPPEVADPNGRSAVSRPTGVSDNHHAAVPAGREIPLFSPPNLHPTPHLQ